MSIYSYDEKSLLKDGHRWFPMMGEIHYSRVEKEDWKRELLKMKAGGIDIVSAYAFWIHHEEIEGQWDFEGCRDLHAFTQAVKDCGLEMILRIGPWCHGEVRNGGFPDWILEKLGNRARTNDEEYFSYVRKLYAKLFEQEDGLLLKDGGPIIGIQIENEFGHCGGLWGEDGEKHMHILTDMAKDVGFDVPLYTATGWGGAVTAGLLPVMGGYCDAPWDPRTVEIEPSGNFIFTHERNDHAIGSDYGLGEGCTFDMTKFPFLTAELGGGLQVTGHRRTIATADDVAAMSITKMGCGCNLLGYYMYHGGTNPEGKLTTLEESVSTGSLNNLPVKNYDFKAPLGEANLTNDSYDKIRRISLFIHDYGEEFTNTDTFIDEKNTLNPEDLNSLRWAWRFNEQDEKSGAWLFVNNYVRHHKMAQHDEETIPVPSKLAKRLGFDHVTVRNVHDGDYFYARVEPIIDADTLTVPLCKLGEIDVVYYLRGGTTHTEGNTIYLSQEDSLKAYKLNSASDKKEFLVLSDSSIYWQEDSGKLSILCEHFEDTNIKIFDERGTVTQKTLSASVSSKSADEHNAITIAPQESSGKKEYIISIPAWTDGNARDRADSRAEDRLLFLYYSGNSASLYKNGKLVDDHFFMGEDHPWIVSLKRFGKDALELKLEINPLHEGDKIYIEKWPAFDDTKCACALDVKRSGMKTLFRDKI